MGAIIEGLISNPTFDSRLNNYADHERAHANRVVAAYFKTKHQCPQLSQREICSRLGVSNNTLAKYKHALRQPFRRSTVTREQKMEALSKALVTRRRNQEYRAFLSELSERGLSADDTQRELNSWRKAHGLGELTQPGEGVGVSPAASPAAASPLSSGNYQPSSQSSGRKKRGGRLATGGGDALVAAGDAGGELLSTRSLVAAREPSAPFSPDDAGYTQFNDRLNEWKRTA